MAKSAGMGVELRKQHIVTAFGHDRPEDEIRLPIRSPDGTKVFRSHKPNAPPARAG